MHQQTTTTNDTSENKIHYNYIFNELISKAFNYYLIYEPSNLKIQTLLKHRQKNYSELLKLQCLGPTTTDVQSAAEGEHEKKVS